MEKMTFDNLETEMFTSQVVWQDFLDALADFYQEQVREPMEGLREVRNITEKTDPNVVLLTLRDLGIDTPLDLILNPDRLMKSVYMIPLIYQHSGLDSMWRVIEFILGRRMSVQYLWTQDYIDFYPEPYGPRRVDGGTWYKTTHVNLTMQTTGSDARIILPRNSTLKDRLLSAFYSYAPVNLVIDKFAFTIDVESSDLQMSAVVEKHHRRVMRFGENGTEIDPNTGLPIRNFSMVGNDKIEMGGSAQYYLEENGFQFFPSEWWSDKPGLVDFTPAGRASFGNVQFDTTVTVFTKFLGYTISKQVLIQKAFDDIRFIQIEGPETIQGGAYADYTVRCFHAHGNDELDTQITLMSPYAKAAFNRVTCEDVSSDQELALHAVYTVGGVDYTAALLVEVKHVDPNLVLTDFYIAGEKELNENSVYLFQANAVFSDGSEQAVLSSWSTSSSVAYADNNGRVTTGVTEGPTDVSFKAKYTFRGVSLDHTFDSTVVQVLNPLVGISIQGPTIGYENNRLQFNALGVFADGTTGVVVADWACEDYYIGADGILEVGTTGDRAKEVIVTAAVRDFTAEHSVNITRDPVVLTSLVIQGPENLHEGAAGAFTALAIFSDGSKQAINPTWSLADSPTWATISNSGIVTFNDPEVGLLEVQADYLKDGVRYTQTKTVVCIAKTNVITGLIVSGPNLVNANERIVLTATAIYKDGTMETVTPKWSASTLDSNATFIAADVVGSGVVQGRDVDSDMDVIITARYFQEEVNYKITVRYVAPMGPDKPMTSRISGPPVFYSNEIASFAQMIRFDQCPNELAVSSDWSLDVNPDIASIDANGFLTVEGNRAATMTVTAVYTCGGYTVTDSIVVSSVVRDSAYSTMLMAAPDTMEIGETAQFSAEVFTLADVVVVGGGKLVACEWEVMTDALNIQVSSNGLLRIVGPVVQTSFTIKATYNDGFETIEVTKTVAVSGSEPLWGTAAIDASADAIFAMTGKLVDGRFQINVGAGRYGFFAYPLVWGLATFKEVTTQIVGGWDGATWPADGSIGSTAGPLTVSRVINGITTQWYIYRTNFSAIGNTAFDVTFS